MNELERHQRAVGAALAALRNVQNTAIEGTLIRLAQDTLGYINSLINPPPVYEEVEITRWECDACGNITRGATPTDECEVCHAFSFTLLTGTRKVEKPQPRERSVSVEASIDQGGVPYGDRYVIAFPQTECHGKRGVLTFTWQE